MIKKITAIVPTYNNAHYLKQCLESILSQGDYIKDIIVINDGSTDNTSEILKKIQQNNKKVTIVDTRNKGVSHARNIGLKMATGEYITFIDSDDYIKRNTFKHIDHKLSQYKNIDVIRYNFEELGGKRYTNCLFDLEDCVLKTEREINSLKRHLLTGAKPIPNLCQLLIIKREIAKKISFNENIHFLEDAIFYQDVISLSNHIAILNEKGYVLRTGDYSSSRAPNRTMTNLISLALANKLLRVKAPEWNDEINKNHFNLFVDKLSRADRRQQKNALSQSLNNSIIKTFLDQINTSRLDLIHKTLLRSLTGKQVYIATYLRIKSIGRMMKRKML